MEEPTQLHNRLYPYFGPAEYPYIEPVEEPTQLHSRLYPHIINLSYDKG